MPARRLSLKREVLSELNTVELALVRGAAIQTTEVVTPATRTADTAYSCYAYLSCNALACVVRETDTIVVHTGACL
jgi:hypothetical protein